MDKRFDELRSDMNSRFEQMTNTFYTLSAIFTTLFAAVFGFAWWDRRSILITARKTAREVVEESMRGVRIDTNTVERLIEVLRKFADLSGDRRKFGTRSQSDGTTPQTIFGSDKTNKVTTLFVMK